MHLHYRDRHVGGGSSKSSGLCFETVIPSNPKTQHLMMAATGTYSLANNSVMDLSVPPEQNWSHTGKGEHP